MTAPHASDLHDDSDPPMPERPDWAAEVQRIAGKARAAGLTPERARREHDERQAVIELDRRRRTHEHNVAAAREQVPARYYDATANHPEVRAWVDDVREARTRDSLVLLGTVGSGKTWQAFGAFRELALAGVGRCMAVTVPAFLDGLRPGRPGTVDYAAVEKADLLLLDDLAAERVTDWTGEVLYRLIDARWASMRFTIITTNATPADVRERMGDRVASRLWGMGRVVTMTGADRRARPTRPTT
jgi:DNA replication protein DnaC